MDITTDLIDSGTYEPLPSSRTIQQSIELPTKNKQIQKRVSDIMKQIEEKNPLLRGKYEFIVFRSDAMQVMHTKGGKIFIPDSLVNLAKNNAALAFILKHEIGHWENGDIKEDRARIPRSPGEIYEAECLADKYGKKVSIILGYDIKHIESFLQKIESKGDCPKNT